MSKISIVCPCMNEELALPAFYEVLKAQVFSALPEETFEIVFVNDGSRDGTLEWMRKMHAEDGRVQYISLSRNFGKEAAMYAGLEHASGDYVCIMDCDLQDPPALIPRMLDMIRSGGSDCVATRRVTRKGEPRIRSMFARLFYRLINRISDTEFVDGARDYRLMTNQMKEAVLRVTESDRFSKGIFMWVGFETEWLEYENIERVAGETKWSFWKLFRYAVEGIISFSIVPIRISTAFGCIASAAALIYMVIRFVIAVLYGNPVAGYPSLLVIMLFLGGVVLFSLGIIGEYVARTYMQAKNRPIYIEKESSF